MHDKDTYIQKDFCPLINAEPKNKSNILTLAATATLAGDYKVHQQLQILEVTQVLCPSCFLQTRPAIGYIPLPYSTPTRTTENEWWGIGREVQLGKKKVLMNVSMWWGGKKKRRRVSILWQNCGRLKKEDQTTWKWGSWRMWVSSTVAASFSVSLLRESRISEISWTLSSRTASNLTSSSRSWACECQHKMDILDIPVILEPFAPSTS